MASNYQQYPNPHRPNYAGHNQGGSVQSSGQHPHGNAYRTHYHEQGGHVNNSSWDQYGYGSGAGDGSAYRGGYEEMRGTWNNDRGRPSYEQRSSNEGYAGAAQFPNQSPYANSPPQYQPPARNGQRTARTQGPPLAGADGFQFNIPPSSGHVAVGNTASRSSNQDHSRQTRRPLIEPVSPKAMSFDNPFPTFPAKKKGQNHDIAAARGAMNRLSLDDGRSSSDRSRHETELSRADPSGQGPTQWPLNFNGPQHHSRPAEASMLHSREGARTVPPVEKSFANTNPARNPRAHDTTSRHPRTANDNSIAHNPPSEDFVPSGLGPRRAMTMPEAANSSNEHGYPSGYTPWQPNATAAYYESNLQGVSSQNLAHPAGSAHHGQWSSSERPMRHGYGAHGSAQTNVWRPPYAHVNGEEWEDGSRAAAIEREMPNFQGAPQNQSHSNHRRGYSIEAHVPTSPTSQGQAHRPSYENQSIYGQGVAIDHRAQEFHSQPEPRGGRHNQNNDFIFEMPGDVPDVPPLPRPTNHATSGTPENRYNGQTQVQASTTPYMGRSHHFPSQPELRHPPSLNVFRNMSESTVASDPGSGAGHTRGMEPRPRQIMPSSRGPQSDSQRSPPQNRTPNPDALPHHPLPVRPGLMEGTTSPQPSKPPPVRQYNTDQSIVQANVSFAGQRRPSQITYAELERLRGIVKSNPADSKTQLILAKKLVEAASVLVDEGGRADPKTRAKNREKYILEAHKIVKKLAGNGYPDALFYMADCHGSGALGLEVNPKEAFSLYQAAAKAGHAAAAYRTAVCCEIGYDEGGGTRQDPLKSVQWYRRAAMLGDTPAMYKMGMILLKGLLGQGRNLGEALNWLKRAADQADEDNPHALHELGLLYSAPTGNDKIIKDDAYALKLFTRAAELGYKYSQFRLGQAYENGTLNCPVDARSSIGWYSRAAAQEEHQSELALSGWYLTGSNGILEQSDTEAYLWAMKAACARPPLPKAMYAMGYFTEVGIGCQRSLDEAKRWYERAASYKFPKAQERLEELKRGGVKVQKNRERLSRTNQRGQDADCVVM